MEIFGNLNSGYQQDCQVELVYSCYLAGCSACMNNEGWIQG